jgi:hypothetical protein
MTIKSQLKAGGIRMQNHNETLQVRTSLKAGGKSLNHNETLARAERAAVSMRRELVTTTRREDRLELLVVRAGLRAGRRARGRGRSRS